MGAWDIGPFDNDDAADWVADLRDPPATLAFLENTFRAVVDLREPYLEAPDASMAIAAAEVLAALRGRPSPKWPLPEEAAAWVEANPHPPADLAPLIELALTAVHRTRTDSELRDLWGETPEVELWQLSLQDLNERLRPASP